VVLSPDKPGIAAEPAEPILYRQDVIETFKAGLGFELTKAQRRSAWEAFQDMGLAVPMNRLLNGDVGFLLIDGKRFRDKGSQYLVSVLRQFQSAITTRVTAV
jgi:hypothetical protein